MHMRAFTPQLLPIMPRRPRQSRAMLRSILPVEKCRPPVCKRAPHISSEPIQQNDLVTSFPEKAFDPSSFWRERARERERESKRERDDEDWRSIASFCLIFLVL